MQSHPLMRRLRRPSKGPSSGIRRFIIIALLLLLLLLLLVLSSGGVKNPAVRIGTPSPGAPPLSQRGLPRLVELPSRSDRTNVKTVLRIPSSDSRSSKVNGVVANSQSKLSALPQTPLPPPAVPPILVSLYSRMLERFVRVDDEGSTLIADAPYPWEEDRCRLT